MNPEKNKRAYTPVSCALYSKLELYALRKRTLLITVNNNGLIEEKKVTIISLRTRNKVEYLVSDDLNEIRLDDIVTIKTYL